VPNGDATAARIERIERELVLRTRLIRLAEPGLEPLAAGFAENVTFAPGAVIYRAGDRPHDFYAFARGEIELAAAGVPPWILKSQSGIGLLDVLADRPRAFTATAVTKVRAMRVAASDYFDFLEERFELVTAALHGVTKDIHEIHLSLAPDGGFPEAAPAGAPAAGPPCGPLSLMQSLGVLRDSPLFRRANVQALARLTALAREVGVDAGDTLFRRGDAAGKFFLVARGVVEATHGAPEIVARFGRADLVCGFGALASADYQYTATARSPVIAFSFAVEDFFDVMEEHFELTRSVLAGMAAEYERLLIERERRAATTSAG